MAWFKYLKTHTSTGYSYPYTKRDMDRFTPKDTIPEGMWLMADVSDLDIDAYYDGNIVKQYDLSGYLVVYENLLGTDLSTSTPVECVIYNDTLYFRAAEQHLANTEISNNYVLYYNTPNIRYVKEITTDSYEVVSNSIAPYAAIFNDVDTTPFDVTLNSETYHNFSFINQSEDWNSGLASRPGAKAYLTFSGPSIDLYAATNRSSGTFRFRVTSLGNTANPYSLVEQDWTVIDLYSLEEQENVLVFSTNNLSQSELTMEIEVLSEKNTLSTGNQVRLNYYSFSVNPYITINSEVLFELAQFVTVGQFGSSGQLIGGSTLLGDTIGPTGPVGPQGGNLIVSATAPTGVSDGSQWLDTNSGRQFAYFNGAWFEVGAAFMGVAGSGGFKNVIINGKFDIWQRGAGPFTGTSDYVADRWNIARSGATGSVTRSQFTPGDGILGVESQYYMSTSVSSVVGSANYFYIQQKIEDVRTFAGNNVTVSFWAKANTNKYIAIEFVQSFGTGGSASVTSIGSQKFAVTTSWKRYSATISIPTIYTKTISTSGDDRLALNFYFDAGTDSNARTASLGHQSGTFDVFGIQVELGNQVTNFEIRPKAAELALCQRYYYRVTSTGGYSPFGMGLCYLTASAIGLITFPVTMRKAPSIIETSGVATDYAAFGPAAVTVVSNSIPTISLQGNTGCMVSFNFASGLTDGRATALYSNNTANAYLGFSAEY